MTAPSSTSDPAGTDTALPQSLPAPLDRDRDRAPVTAIVTARPRAEGQLPAEALQRRRGLVVAHQPVGQPVRGRVQRARARDAEVGLPGATQVLDGDLGPDVP